MRLAARLVLACFVLLAAHCGDDESESQSSPAPDLRFASTLQLHGGSLVPISEDGLSSTMLDGVILSFFGPSELIPGQSFRLRLSSDYRGQYGSGTALLHVRGSEHAFLIDSQPYPSPASVPGRWSVDVHGVVGQDAELGGHDYRVQLALTSPEGLIGPIVEWNPTIMELPALSGCPFVANCIGRSCGAEPLCGVDCGGCAAGSSCSDLGVCEPVGLACPVAAECGLRECGADPVCGAPCGPGCAPGSMCNAQGRCQVLPPDTPQVDPMNCVPDCTARVCGLDPLCPIASCGSCSTPYTCEEGSCVCVPDCGERECGTEPKCRTECGQCPGGWDCEAGRCVQEDASSTSSTGSGGDDADTTDDTESSGDEGSESDDTGCADGELTCNGKCVDHTSSLEHCGRCNNPCVDGRVCVDGRCELTCPDEFTVCGDQCVDLDASSGHCGACDAVCAAPRACNQGMCECNQGSFCADRCVDLQTDEDHCGGCERDCATGEVCESGQCRLNCPSGLTNCSGTCRDLQSDRANCGRCGNRCADGELCSAGRCELNCDTGLTKCDNTCVDTSDNEDHCGRCDNDCDANEACIDGRCELQCDDGFVDCDGECVDPQTDPNHCGADVEDCSPSGTVCRPDEACVAGSCDAADPWMDWPDTSFMEVIDPTTGGTVSELDTAIASDGTTYVLWSHWRSPEGFQVLVARRGPSSDPTQGWDPPVVLMEASGWFATDLQLVIDDDRLTAVWAWRADPRRASPRGDNSAGAWSSSLAKGASQWSTPVQVDVPDEVLRTAGGFDGVDAPSVSANAGTVAVAYRRPNWQAGVNINNGSGWLMEGHMDLHVPRPNYGENEFAQCDGPPSILAFGNGDLFLIRECDSNLWANWYDSGATSSRWSQPLDLADIDDGAPTPTLAAISDTLAFVLWYDYKFGELHLGQFDTAAPMGMQWSAQNIANPRQNDGYGMSVNASGHGFLYWVDPITRRVQAQRIAGAQGLVGQPEEISFPDDEAFDPQISVDSAGNALSTWWRTQSSPGRANFPLVSRTYRHVGPANTGWGAVHIILDSTAAVDALIGKPSRVELGDGGHGMATWFQQPHTGPRTRGGGSQEVPVSTFYIGAHSSPKR